MSILLSNPPQLAEELERRTNKVRSRILKTNYKTKFAQTAFEIDEFRHATAGILDGMDDDALFELFRKTVQFTSYDSYAPLLARFFEHPCKQSAVVDLMSPGVPDYILKSSSTSGGSPKWFPSYNSSDHRWWMAPNPLRKRTHAFIRSFGLFGKIDVQGKDSDATTIYLSYGTVRAWRIRLGLDPEKDEEKMETFLLDHTAPYAVGFIKKWRSFLLIHALFALGSRSLEVMSMPFITSFVEMMRCLDMEFDTIVGCIANGTLPDLDGIGDVRHYLEVNISPNPERAAELRKLGRPSSRLGWCSHAWPNLGFVKGPASGTFASSVPLARCFLGPNIHIHSVGYACTEALIGIAYRPLELNRYKLSGQNIFEFLDVNKSDSISNLAQVWEVEPGRRYEVVITTGNGLWRYRLGDVIEIAGFDPTDGAPIVQFIERRHVAIRLKGVMVTENELRAAMSLAIPNTPVKVVDWTAMVDNRRLPATIGFFVELSKPIDQFPNPASMVENILNALSGSNENIAKAFTLEDVRKPTIRIVRPGMFSDFRQMKLDEGSNNLGQIKVPVVLSKPEHITWFSDGVVQEL